MKTRYEILQQTYVNKTDISKLLMIPMYKATKIFSALDQEEDKELGVYRVDNSKVKLSRLLKNTHTDYDLLLRQVENEKKVAGTTL